MGEIIPRNTVVPTSRSKIYTTAEDGQTAVTNKVFEGERKLTKDNRLLGQFELTGIPPMDFVVLRWMFRKMCISVFGELVLARGCGVRRHCCGEDLDDRWV